jgi:hypothetical protein
MPRKEVTYMVTGERPMMASGSDQTVDAGEMSRVLELQALDVAEEDIDFFGNSCSSSNHNCCNG